MGLNSSRLFDSELSSAPSETSLAVLPRNSPAESFRGVLPQSPMFPSDVSWSSQLQPSRRLQSQTPILLLMEKMFSFLQ